MGRLKVIIADPDEGYVQGLSDYISSFHSYRFEVCSFTRLDYLLKFLSKKDNSIDAVLISPEYYLANDCFKKIERVVLLTSAELAQDVGRVPVINKYQHAEKLISSLVDVLSGSLDQRVAVPGAGKSAKTIGVYSSSGGAGKTTIALGCSIHCAMQGFKVFYLNLELINSIHFLEFDKQKSLSKVLFYLKEKKSNLILKVEGLRCIDSRYGIHYFSPADSPFDLEDASAEELAALIKALRSMGQYDFIFIDMSSCFNRASAALLREYDRIVFLTGQDRTSTIRHNNIVDMLPKLYPKDDFDIINRSLTVINKYDYTCQVNIENYQHEERGLVKIPIVREGINGGMEACLADKEFMNGIGNLVEWLI